MLVQIMTLTSEFYGLAKLNINNYIKANYTKISAVGLATKMVLAVSILAIVPVGTTKVSRQTYQTAVKLDTNSPMALVSSDRQVAIATGASALDAKTRVATHGQLAYASHQAEPEGIENYLDLYKSAASQYGIPWQVLAAVHYVESGASGSTDRSSYAGAQGPMQFMPGTWRAYGVDANGDGVADATNVQDAVYGAANLLAAGGAAEGNVDGALFNYNHAQWYVDKVNEVASSIQ